MNEPFSVKASPKTELQNKAKTPFDIWSNAPLENRDKQLWVPLEVAEKLQKENTQLQKRVLDAEKSRNSWSLRTQELEGRLATIQQILTKLTVTPLNPNWDVLARIRAICSSQENGCTESSTAKRRQN